MHKQRHKPFSSMRKYCRVLATNAKTCLAFLLWCLYAYTAFSDAVITVQITISITNWRHAPLKQIKTD